VCDTGPRKAVTLSSRRGILSREEIRDGIELIDEHEGFEPPRVRSDCQNGPRPCLWVRCKYNLYLDVTESGSIKVNFPDRGPGEMEHSCALDEADRGGMTLTMIAERLNVSRERVRQVEFRILRKLRRHEEWLDLIRTDHLDHYVDVVSYTGDDGDLPEPVV